MGASSKRAAGRGPRAAAAAFAFMTLSIGAAAAATLPSGFTETQVASGLPSPTTMALAPDGRLFVCLQGGSLQVIKNGALLPTPFATFSVNASGERGLLGVAFDPDFSVTPYVYVYYTTSSSPIHNRVSRVTANGDVAVTGSEVVLLDLDNLSSATNHNGGALHFGPDGMLYVAAGENATPSNAQTVGNLLGKVLRIARDGSIPTDNPFYSSATGKNRAIWALGLRNPFTFAFQPGTGRMFINDVGQDTQEEIDDGIAGSNYGWPDSEGPTSNPSHRGPIFYYGHGSSGSTGCAITGGDFYNPVTATFPPDYAGDYFFADYCSGWIRRIDPAASPVTATAFATGLSSAVDLEVSPGGDLYYLARGSGSSTGVVYKVSYTASQAPAITTEPSNTTVSVGQPATFTVAASGSAPLSYQWQRNGVNVAGATAASYTLAAAQLSDSNAAFRCVVTNSFGSATSNPAMLTVTSNTPPIGTIGQPAAGTLYSAGETFAYAGTGTDAEDGTLPASSFTWEVVFHHDTHTHPFVPPTSGSKTGSFTIPTNNETSSNVWYRIHLTVRDSGGLTQESTRDLTPRKSTVMLATSPSALQLKLDGQPVAAPTSFVGVVGIVRNLEAVSPQTVNGTTWVFASWSDGAARVHDISTPVSNTTYTATYAKARAQMASPSPGSTLGSSSVAFSWTAGTGVTSYGLQIGSTVGGSDVFAGAQYSTTSTTISGLPTDGRVLYVRLWSLVSGTWENDDFTYTASGNAGSASLSINDVTVTEGNSGTTNAIFTVTRSGSTSPSVTVSYATANGTAMAGSDYVATAGSLTLSPGVTTGTIIVAVNGDSTVEANETFVVNLSNPAGATLARAQGRGTIVNDDVSTPTKASMVSPAPGSTLTSSTATFTWTAGVGVSSYGLQVGTTPGGTQIIAGTQYFTTSATIGGLPTNGSLVYVRLWSLLGGTWQSSDYIYTAASAP
jgi:glucose/arabinose dehydrogenase